jgi:hypothetical protein
VEQIDVKSGIWNDKVNIGTKPPNAERLASVHINVKYKPTTNQEYLQMCFKHRIFQTNKIHYFFIFINPNLPKKKKM